MRAVKLGDIDLRSGADGRPQSGEPASHRVHGRRHGHRHHHRRNLLVIVTASAIALVPWIINLALTLPRRYVATDWRLTWVGFTSRCWRSSAPRPGWAGTAQLVLLTAFTTGVLLCCDAWFDVTTAEHHDRFTSVAAAFVEIPLAILLFRASWRLLRLAAGTLGHEAPDGTRLSIWRMPILGPAEAAADPASMQQGRFADPCAQTNPLDQLDQPVQAAQLND